MLLARSAMLLETSLSPQAVASLIIGVVVFAGLLALTFFTLRWLQKRGLPGLGGGHVKVLERTTVSHECAVLLVSIGSRLVALGQSKNGLSYLCELDPRDYAANKVEKGGKGGFWGRFVRNMGTRWDSQDPSGDDARKGAEKAKSGSMPGEPSFHEIFAQIAANENLTNPIPGAAAPESGYTAVRPRPESRYGEPAYAAGGYAARNARPGGEHGRENRSYQEGFERLMSLGEPDKLDSRMHAPAVSPFPKVVRRSPVRGEAGMIPSAVSPAKTAESDWQNQAGAKAGEAAAADGLPEVRDALLSGRETAPAAANTENGGDNAVMGGQLSADMEQSPAEAQEEAKIDDLLDRIAQRQSRYTKDKDA